MTEDLFQGITLNPVKREKMMARPAARHSYVIHFTPRSGSSWLTDVLAATGRLSAANEAFNPGFIPNIAKSLNATDLDSYIALLKRRFNTRGIYGFEITAHHIRGVFGTYEAFHHHFAAAPAFWLIRQDIVAQAVSLAKMVATNVSHTVNSDPSMRAASEQQFTYDAGEIKRWMTHIHAAEIASEQWFDAYGVTPLRMSYEQTTRLSPHQMVNVFARNLGMKDIPAMPIKVGHSKLGTDQNATFAERFRKDQARHMATVDEQRAAMLAKLDPIAEMVADLATT